MYLLFLQMFIKLLTEKNGIYIRETTLSAVLCRCEIISCKMRYEVGQTLSTKSGDNNSVTLQDHSVLKVCLSVLYLHSPFKTFFF